MRMQDFTDSALSLLTWVFALSVTWFAVSIILYGTTGVDTMPYFSAPKGG